MRDLLHGRGPIPGGVLPVLDPTDEINRGCIVWWPMFEKGGTIHNIAQARHHATLNANATWTTSQYGATLSLATSSASADTLPELASVQHMSASAWFKRSAASDHCSVISNFGAESTSCVIVAYTDGKVYLESDWQVNGGGYGAFALNDTNWHHVVMVFDGTATGNSGRLRGWLDGKEISLTYAGTIAAVTGPSNVAMSIGAHAGTNSTGLRKNIRIWKRSLRASEIERLYAQPWAGLGMPEVRIPYVERAVVARDRMLRGIGL